MNLILVILLFLFPALSQLHYNSPNNFSKSLLLCVFLKNLDVGLFIIKNPTKQFVVEMLKSDEEGRRV